MRKLHLDNKEVVQYRIHSELLEIRRNGKKTLVKHEDFCKVLGVDPYYYCCEMQCEGRKAQIKPSMVKSYISIMTGLEQAKNRQFVSGPKL